jgi:hypothetical protein
MLLSRFNMATTPVFVRRRRRGGAETHTPSASADVVRGAIGSRYAARR